MSEARVAGAHHVYLLECADGTLYAGYAVDVARRLAVHNAGRGAKYTRGRLPVKLLASWSFASRGDALREELRIKALPRDAKVALVAGARRKRRARSAP